MYNCQATSEPETIGGNLFVTLRVRVRVYTCAQVHSCTDSLHPVDPVNHSGWWLVAGAFSTEVPLPLSAAQNHMSNILGFKYRRLILLVTITIYTFYLFITGGMINRNVILFLAEFYFLLGIQL